MASGSKGKLNTGAEIPLLGFGTWQDKDEQEPAILAALKAGYRHIDTARIYGTEPAVGSAIKKSGIPREEIFVTTKLWNHKHHPDDVEAAFEASLKDLGTDYVDLYLMVSLHGQNIANVIALACFFCTRRAFFPRCQGRNRLH
jgi:alcohol dehydrogenase (NADP+)